MTRIPLFSIGARVGARAWTRRHWLIGAAHTAAFAMVVPFRRARAVDSQTLGVAYRDPATAERLARQMAFADPDTLRTLVLRALDAAKSAGARYADARLTRSVGHVYDWQSGAHRFAADTEVQGIGVRALVDGYWGFAAAAVYDPDAVVRLAQDSVAQAKTNATVSRASTLVTTTSSVASAPAVELAPAPAVTGTWVMPVVIDPFAVPIEEKLDHIASWDMLAVQRGFIFPQVFGSSLIFVREECTLGTTEGTLVTQTTYQTGGHGALQLRTGGSVQPQGGGPLTGLGFAGRGWELVLDAKIPEQIEAMAALRASQPRATPAKSFQVGRYTLVCDGTTMASLLDQTLGSATQLDRALGYEANATGTSYLNDPLTMLGTLQAAAPLVTVKANRSAPTQLATVRWDAEGVVPDDVALIEHGILADYQTTREQAQWLAPYYEKSRRPVRSHGYAGAENALVTSLQMVPNLALAAQSETVRLDDLIASVSDGILITGGNARTDFQGRTGMLNTQPGAMREIKNGRLGKILTGGAVRFDSTDLWKKITAVGGTPTVATMGQCSLGFIYGGIGGNGGGAVKGEPAQCTPYTVQAPAAVISEQAIVDFARTR